MKFRNVLLLAMIPLMSGLMIMTSCKKGPEDPGLSFKSRMGRITGTWELNEYTKNGEDLLVTVDTMQNTTTPSCGTKLVTVTTEVRTEWTFEKNGDYSSESGFTMTERTTYSDPQTGICENETEVDNNIEETDGRWNFAGGAGDTKNKEYIVLTDLDGEPIAYIQLIRLSNKELIFEQIIETSNKRTIYRWVMTKIS